MSVAAWTLQGITDLYVFTAAMSTNSVITRKVDRTPDYIQADRTSKFVYYCGGNELWVWVFSRRRWWCYGSNMFSNHPRSFPTGSAPPFSFYTPASFPKLLEVIADLEEQIIFFVCAKHLFEKK